MPKMLASYSRVVMQPAQGLCALSFIPEYRIGQLCEQHFHQIQEEEEEEKEGLV